MQSESKYLTKRQRLITVFGGVLLAILIGVSVKSPKNDDLQQIKEKGELTVACDNSIFGYNQQSDSLFGYNYEIAKAFANSINVTLKVISLNNRGQQLEALHQNDCHIIAQVSPIITDVENEKIVFSTPLFTSRLVLIQQMDTNQLENYFQLEKVTITIPADNALKMRIKNLSEEIAQEIYITELLDVNTEKAIQMVSDGTIKYTVCSELEARTYKQKYTNIDITLPLSFNQEYAWIINKNTPNLKNKLDEFLAHFVETKQYRDIFAKYF